MIDYPVRMTEDYQIVDKFNRTVVPDLTWKQDYYHKKEQRVIGELIVTLLNKKGIHNAEEALEAGWIVGASHSNGSEPKSKRGRGRPKKQ